MESDLPSLMLTGLPSLKRVGGFLCAFGSGMLWSAGEGQGGQGKGRGGQGRGREGVGEGQWSGLPTVAKLQ